MVLKYKPALTIITKIFMVILLQIATILSNKDFIFVNVYKSTINLFTKIHSIV